MARPDAVTYEQVELVCVQLKAEGIEPSVRQVVQRVGGSNTTVLEHVKRWKASNPKTVPVRSDELPIDVMGSLQAMRDRAEATGEAKFAARLKEAEDERNDVAKENKQLQAQNAGLQLEAADLATDRDTLKGQVQSHELELQTLRGQLKREQESAQAARVELAKAQLKVEAADSRVAEAQQRETKALADVSRVSAALDVERTARAGADSRAAVAESQLASTADALQAGQARVEDLQTAVKEHDAIVARVAGAEAMAHELRSMVEMLRELLKAAEERSLRAGAPPAPERQPGAGEKSSKGNA